MNLLSKSGLSLERLRSFLLFADSRSITKAAKGDPVRVSLISRQLRELEEFFEVELVAKRGKGLVLTSEGTKLAGLIREQFSSLEDFGNTAKGSSVRLSLAGSGTILQWLVAPRLNPASLPSISFDLLHESEADMIEHLQDGRLDLAIISKQPLGRQFASSPLGVLDFALYVPKSFKKVKNLKEALRQYPLALPIGGRVRESILAHSGCILNTCLGTTGYSAAAAAVRGGQYASILPVLASVELGDDVCRIDIPESVIPKRAVVLSWKQRAASTRPAVQAAVEGLKQLLRWD
jgi:DNA-binding transcriptional LysR family regulator